MFRILTPLILIGLSVAGFVTLIAPLYEEITELKQSSSAYDEALVNSKSLENERDKLTKKSNSISTQDLERIKKLLPDNVDNIRLILEVEKIASPYGMVVRDIRYNIEKEQTGKVAASGGEVAKPSSRDYGVWDLEFSTEGTYEDFLAFTRDLEANLRLLDVVSIQFISNSAPSTKSASTDTYKYGFKVRTYWLRN